MPVQEDLNQLHAAEAQSAAEATNMHAETTKLRAQIAEALRQKEALQQRFHVMAFASSTDAESEHSQHHASQGTGIRYAQHPLLIAI